jgi:molybdate transport system substrate-binding protein
MLNPMIAAKVNRRTNAPGVRRPRLACNRSVRILDAFCIVAALAILGGCRQAKPEPTPTPREDKLVVFAAASLREAFAHESDEFKKSHPGIEVTFNFAGTQEIRTQLEQGAPADVFASADERHMKALLDTAKVEAPAIFAQNEPVLVVSKEKAASIHSLAELPLAERIVIGAPEVPIGKYTLQILDKASRNLGADFRTRVEAKVVSRELNVRQVLAKVTLGEADAGIVYRTDLGPNRDKVSVVTIPPELNIIAEYPIAIVRGALHPVLSQQWVSLILSERGQTILRDSGFIVAPANKAAH